MPQWQQHFREMDGSSRKPEKAYHNSIYTFSAFTKTINPAFLLLARLQMGKTADGCLDIYDALFPNTGGTQLYQTYLLQLLL